MPTYAYISGQGAIVKTLEQLRRSFPAQVDAGFLQRNNIAPANESYVISILRFLGFIDDDGNKRDESVEFFFGDDAKFASGLEAALRSAYKALFDEKGEDAWSADPAELTHWFRVADKTSETVGKRQASTFKALASMAGHGTRATPRSAPARTKERADSRAAKKKTSAAGAKPAADSRKRERVEDGAPTDPSTRGEDRAPVGLTVRIEVNLPAGADADTYDAIFASVRKHLMP